jgi:hypothetical protein
MRQTFIAVEADYVSIITRWGSNTMETDYLLIIIWLKFVAAEMHMYCDGIWPFARQRLSKHCLNAEIIAEAEVIFARQRLEVNTCSRGNEC